MPEKVDFKKTLKYLYNPSKRDFHLVEVPAMNFLMVDGIGNPNTAPVYQQAVEALYNVAYGIKFAMKRQGFDHIVPPMEGLWWMEDMSEFSLATKDRWLWTMMIMQPDWVAEDTVQAVRRDAIKKKNNPMLEAVRFERYTEGLAVQSLYIGAYADEAPVIADMHKFIATNGLRTNGKHHEIYLGDQRKTSPDKLQTILRQPVIKNT